VRTDGAFEAVLGLVLVSAWLGPADFPDPVGTPLIIAFGVSLLGVGALLWRLADTIDLRALGAANATTAAALAWCLAAGGFSAAGRGVTIATAAALAILAAAQFSGRVR
jgi:hypothetical protein